MTPEPRDQPDETCEDQASVTASEPGSPALRAPEHRVGWWLPIGFLAVAALLATRSRGVAIPNAGEGGASERSIGRDDPRLVPAPRRIAISDPPSALVRVPSPREAHGALPELRENCRACHQIFPSRAPSPESGEFHRIELRHGMNDRCVNCHDTGDRERLTLRDGSTVPFVDSPTLCAQCHGTLFRDWQAGTHGKTLGSWRTGSAEQRRLHCVECHDPHSPKYPAYEPLPAPNTLRMGEQRGHGSSHAPDESPLRRARDRHAAPSEQENGHG